MSKSGKHPLFEEFPPVSTEEWEKIIERDLKGANYKEKLRWHTGEGLSPLPFYRQEDLEKLDHVGLIAPGQKRSWEIREAVCGSTIDEARSAARRALQSGAEALHLGMSLSADTTGRSFQLRGVPVQSQSDFSKLTEGLSLGKAPLHLDGGPLSPALMALFHGELSSRNLSPADISGSVLFDPFAIQLRHGIPFEPDVLLQIFSFVKQHLPNVRTCGIDARLYHNSGGTIIQELGFALASAAEILAILTENEYTIDEAANSLHFNFSVGSTYFLEIAKFRAIRLLWDNLLDAFGGRSGQTPAYIHGQSSRWNKTGYDPYTNMLRTSTEGMSAVLGECDALTILPFDEIFRRPDEFSRRIARNSQIIMREEAYLDKVKDPGAGSYYIEQLTNDMAREAWQLFQEVEKHDGMSQAIQEGFVQSSIKKSRQEKNRAIASRKRIFVGTSQYPDPGNNNADELKNQRPVTALNLSGKTISSPFTVAELTEAFAGGATLGDIASAALAGADPEATLLRPYRGARAFEELRLATEQSDQTPKVLNLPLGNPKIRKARSTFSNNFFGCAGYDIEDPIGFEDIPEAVDAIRRQQPDIAVLCSSDKEYEQLVPSLCKQLNTIDERPMLVLAGYPKEQIESYEKAGIDLFIYDGCNVLKTLKEVQQKLGIIIEHE